ncbi:class I SAM-dependent methyltransferase [Marivibrio halodurans]|uniref:Class I SAM-dependent methyltransferase n=1 Tax=Marivibrio halodurans TaxID=2039722 RepID=A0A8J7S2J7_9PROT|nr:class I SAM-dependent methyltransferase [Marivibrio halodurans]MBP5857398.1 class I SAM-dependent methyltransferase [Marivibrio halodurans]
MTTPHDHSRPSPWIARFADDVPEGGAILDLACGAGRHGRHFLARGHAVTFLDRDIGRLHDLRGVDGARIVEADLETDGPFPLDGERFAAVVVVNYLWRPILKDIPRLVAPGGLLLYETFMAGNEALGRPRNPDFLLRPGELRDLAAPAFDILAFEEGRTESPAPAIKQWIAARRRE